MLRKMIDSKSLEKSKKNIMMEFDLIKVKVFNLNTASLLLKSPQILSGINLE